MLAIRTLPFALFSVLSFAFAGGMLACSGSSDEEPAGSDDALETTTTCERPSIPSDLKGLEKYSSCQLKALFESDDAKALTAASPILDGAYDGVPLCRKADIRPILSDTSVVPANVKAVGGIPALRLLSLSETFDNTVAGEIWHGKHFTPGPEKVIGDVNNYIDITAQGTGEDVHRSAEARFFIDPNEHWLVLDYSKAATGLRVLRTLSTKLVRQVYDTARLVDKEKNLWVGMAWFVNDLTGETEGMNAEDERAESAKRYSPEKKGTVIPSCYFALKKK